MYKVSPFSPEKFPPISLQLMPTGKGEIGSLKSLDISTTPPGQGPCPEVVGQHKMNSVVLFIDFYFVLFWQFLFIGLLIVFIFIFCYFLFPFFLLLREKEKRETQRDRNRDRDREEKNGWERIWNEFGEGKTC